jgi:hypothetical protein
VTACGANAALALCWIVMASRVSPLIAVALAAAASACGTSPEFRPEPNSAIDRAAGDQVASVEPLTEPKAPAGTTVSGRWKGVGQQSNGSEWDVVLEVGDFGSKVCGTVRYPSIGCMGTWYCKGGFHPDGFDAIEKIEEGGRCVDGVAIRLHLADDAQSVIFFAKGGGQRAAGRLHRVE